MKAFFQGWTNFEEFEFFFAHGGMTADNVQAQIIAPYK